MARNNKEVDVKIAQPGELGVLLEQYRDEAGYTVTQTADALCLAENTIIKLENEEFESLAEPPYIRGYLRGYAKIAEKDPAELISIYENLRGASPDELTRHFKPVSSLHHKKSVFPGLTWLLVLGVFVIALGATSMIPEVRNWFSETWNSFSQQTAKQVYNPVLTGNLPNPLPIPTPLESTTENDQMPLQDSQIESAQEASSSDETNSLPINPENQQDSATSNPQSISDNTNSANDEVDSQTAVENNPTGTVKIKLVFNKEVWLRIKDKNQKTVYEGQNEAGKEKELELEKPLTFRVGNAQGISIFVDNQPKDISSYIKGSIANFTIQ